MRLVRERAVLLERLRRRTVAPHLAPRAGPRVTSKRPTPRTTRPLRSPPPRKSGLPDLRIIDAELGQARVRSRSEWRGGGGGWGGAPPHPAHFVPPRARRRFAWAVL